MFHRTRWQNNRPTIVSKICKKKQTLISYCYYFAQSLVSRRNRPCHQKELCGYEMVGLSLILEKGFSRKVPEHTENWLGIYLDTILLRRLGKYYLRVFCVSDSGSLFSGGWRA